MYNDHDEGDTITLLYDELVYETARALLFRFGDREVWIPKSVVGSFLGDGEMDLPLWFCEQEGLEVYEV
jgi:hypothetical protein